MTLLRPCLAAAAGLARADGWADERSRSITSGGVGDRGEWHPCDAHFYLHAAGD